MPVAGAETNERGWRWHEPWAALVIFSALLNVVWEVLAISFYETVPSATTGHGFPVGCLLAAMGDVGITLIAYGTASAIGTRRWIFRPSIATFATFLGIGLLVTILFEYVNVSVLHRWSYGSGMPMIAGIGTLPLLQWLVLPPIVIWLARRHLMGAQ